MAPSIAAASAHIPTVTGAVHQGDLPEANRENY
jgi:hypothetical protein